MKATLLILLGGGIGSVLRYFFGLGATKLFGSGFPWGTLGVNVIGGFLMGLFAELLMRRFDGSEMLRLFIATGVLGGFTTFSTFSLDTIFLWERISTALAFIYVVASVIGSISALFVGLWLARSLG
ncbi:MAG: fluoride efflux transporter CrcB [Phyllobacterium sp.]